MNRFSASRIHPSCQSAFGHAVEYVSDPGFVSSRQDEETWYDWLCM